MHNILASEREKTKGELADKGAMLFIVWMVGVVMNIVDGPLKTTSPNFDIRIWILVLVASIFTIYNSIFFPIRKKSLGKTIGQENRKLTSFRLDGEDFDLKTSFIRNFLGKNIIPIGGAALLIYISSKFGLPHLLWFGFITLWGISSTYLGGDFNQGYWDKMAGTVTISDNNDDLYNAIFLLNEAPAHAGLNLSFLLDFQDKEKAININDILLNLGYQVTNHYNDDEEFSIYTVRAERTLENNNLKLFLNKYVEISKVVTSHQGQINEMILD